MIAKQMGISERGIYRKIENLTDKTLHQIIRESRIELASKLLVSSKLTIDEIMYKSGYDNRSSFHRNFKELKGMAPKDYRNSVKNNINQYI
jgi:AraC-like DNA-binding protein